MMSERNIYFRYLQLWVNSLKTFTPKKTHLKQFFLKKKIKETKQLELIDDQNLIDKTM